MPKMTWVDRKHHELLFHLRSPVLNFSIMIHPLPGKEIPLEVILERCCGTDVHVCFCLCKKESASAPKGCEISGEKKNRNYQLILLDEVIFRTIKPSNRLMLELMARGGMRIQREWMLALLYGLKILD
jgi:hypothetical protein